MGRCFHNHRAAIYTRDNCSFCCPLELGVSVFWRSPVAEAPWFDELRTALEPDGIRVLGHRFVKPGVSQFAVSTKPDVAPLVIVQQVKGRLQYGAFVGTFGEYDERVVVSDETPHHGDKPRGGEGIG